MCDLAISTDPNLIVGFADCEDAGVYKLNDEMALIQTLDFFTPIVDNPYDFGQITAANSLSDVYAMGGKPLLAMNIVCFPIKDMDNYILKNIIKGGLDKINEAGALLVGGHSVEDPEIKYGLSVTGVVHPNKVIRNSTAKAGDQLLLTKPIGTGILSTAIKGGLADADIELMITMVMATLNKEASEIMISADGGVNGCTDITGFGLIGHLYEMASASGVSIKIKGDSVPVLPESINFATMGIIPEGAYKNKMFYEKYVDFKLTENSGLEMLFYDPQTSGGLLIAADPATIHLISINLAKNNYNLDYGVIGEVVDGPAGTITVT